MKLARAIIGSRFKVFLLGLLGFVLAVFFLTETGRALNRVQFLSFPFLLFLWLGFAPSYLRIPKTSLFGLLLVWLSVGLSNFNFLPRAFLSVAIADLSDDPSSERVQEFRQGYRRIARAYGLPPMRVLGRKLTESEKEVGLRDALFTLSGHSESLSATLGREFRSIPEDIVEELGRDGGRLSDALVGGGDFFQPEIADGKYLWLSSSSTFRLPNSNPSISQFFIAWMAEAALHKHKAETVEDLEVQEMHRIATRQALSHAAEVSKLWKVPTPAGVSRLLLANEIAYEAMRTGDPEELKCALRTYAAAGAMLQDKGDKEWFLKVLNNAGVLLAHSANTRSSLRKAYNWLSRASRFKSSDGKPLPLAQVPVYNLRQFTRTRPFDRPGSSVSLQENLSKPS